MSLWQSRKSDFAWHRFRFSPCLMRKTVEKFEAILALLDSFVGDFMLRDNIVTRMFKLGLDFMRQ